MWRPESAGSPGSSKSNTDPGSVSLALALTRSMFACASSILLVASIGIIAVIDNPECISQLKDLLEATYPKVTPSDGWNLLAAVVVWVCAVLVVVAVVRG
eukprot:SAG31_NODE_267_length_18790_cov_3.661655_1_plen_100_part_00